MLKIVHAFADLRKLVGKDILTYPYSTREAVAVVKHLEMFPEDGLVTTLENVLGFDSYDPHLRETIADVFQQHGIPLQDSLFNHQNFDVELSDSIPKPVGIKTEEWSFQA